MLKSKDEFLDSFRLWFPRAEAGGSRLTCLLTDCGDEFISVALQSFCQERGIKIGYAAPYIQKEKGIAKECWSTFARRKNVLFIDR